MTTFVGVLLPVVAGLGIWQLERADEKKGYESTYLTRLAELPVPVSVTAEDFRRVRLTGEFDRERYFLLDNQIRQGVVGFAVVGVFITGDGGQWLLNRGFVPGDRIRGRLPEVEVPRGRVTTVGVIWPDLGLMPLLDATRGEDHWGEGWPKVIQRLELERMAASLDQAQAVEIRLEAGQAGVLAPPSLEMNMPSAKHMGYAVQWFGLAAALLAGYLFFGFRRHE